jgi:hypothetical protein
MIVCDKWLLAQLGFHLDRCFDIMILNARRTSNQTGAEDREAQSLSECGLSFGDGNVVESSYTRGGHELEEEK